MEVTLVVNSAKIKCKYCNEPGELIIPPTSGILVTGQWVASKYDVLVPINIKPFSHCEKRLKIEGIDLCIPEKIMPWENTKEDIKILGDIPAITNHSYAVCIYCGSNKINILDGGQGLIQVDEILYWEFPDLEELLKNPDFVKWCQSPQFHGIWDPTTPEGLEHLKHLWDVCQNKSNEIGFVVDPLFFLGIIQAEGSGSFNTAYAKTGHIANKNFMEDCKFALDLVVGKMLAYGVYYDKFKEECDKYKTMSAKGNLYFNGGFFEYAQYALPWLEKEGNNYKKTTKVYGTGANWNSVVSGQMGKFLQMLQDSSDNPFDLAEKYSEYLRGQIPNGLSGEAIRELNDKVDLERAQYSYIDNGRKYTDGVIDFSDYDKNNMPPESVLGFIVEYYYSDEEPGNYGGRNAKIL